MSLFKVWSQNGLKKAVVVKDLQSLLQSGCEKLGIENMNVTAYLEDGTEVDGDDILQCLPPASVIYLLGKDDKKPWTIPDVPESTSTTEDVNITFEVCSQSSKSDSDVSLKITQKPWPAKFPLHKELFSDNLNKALLDGYLPWAEKSELLNHLANQIKKFTYNPTIKERNQVACLLVEEFPKLKSDIGEGYFAWSNRIYDKMRELRRKKRQLMKRGTTNDSYENVPQTRNSQFKRIRTRGQINVMPDAPDGENAVTLLNHKKWLQNEIKKDVSIRDKHVIHHKMELTFHDRRSMVNKHLPVIAIRDEYPFLFTNEGMAEEFCRLMNFDIDKTVLFELNKIYLPLLRLSNEKKDNDIKVILQDFESKKDKNLNDNLIVCILLLPLLFSEHSGYLYKIYPPETSWLDLKEDEIITPHVAVIGNPYDSTLNFIVTEKEIVLESVEFLQAIISCIAIYYCCNIKYPDNAKCSLAFIDCKLLKNNETAKIPRKVLTLLEKINQD